MMGPWLIMGGLILGATVFMYDGSPDYPAPDRVWDMVEAARHHGVGHHADADTGADARIGGIRRPPRDAHPAPARLHRRAVEPSEPWLWTLEHVGKNRAPIINYSGGTGISGGILGCTVLRPLKPCSFNTVAVGD